MVRKRWRRLHNKTVGSTGLFPAGWQVASRGVVDRKGDPAPESTPAVLLGARPRNGRLLTRLEIRLSNVIRLLAAGIERQLALCQVELEPFQEGDLSWSASCGN